MLNPDSLAATLDALNQVFFTGGRIARGDRVVLANWLASRIGLPDSYEAMPAPTEVDLRGRPRLFTGEGMDSRGGAACKLGNEACRALILLEVRSPRVQGALERAEQGMAARLASPDSGQAGRYCCGSCSVAVWRHLAVGGLDHQEARLAAGLARLSERLQPDGSWEGAPFWYASLALTEIELPQATRILRHAAAAYERAVRKPAQDMYALRRQEVARRALARV